MDLILDDEFDIKIEDGEFVVKDTYIQAQNLLLQTDKNDWKENPPIGVGVELYLEDEDTSVLYGEIREQYRLSGMTIKSLQKVKDNIVIIRER